jgi:glycosyltransferase involved in cell wall biosynthesis
VRAPDRGIGASIKTGTRAARSAWVTFLPADGQIAPASLGTLLEAQEASGADVVFSVYTDRDDGLRRKILSAGVRLLIRVTQWTRLRSDGPYLFRRILFDADALHSDSFFLNFEFPIRAITSGAATTVVSIPCQPRRSGESKSANFGKIVHVTRDLLALRVRRSLERLGG